MVTMTRAQNLGLKETYSEWFTCVYCNKNNIMRKFKYCPSCGEELDWTFYRDED